MTREEAVKIMQLNKGRMNGSVQAALAVLLPELDAPQRTVLEWRTCKAGDQLGLRALIRYPAYAEIGYYAKADGDWVPMEDIEHQQEKICATCAYFDTRTRWNGYCDAGAEKVVVAAETTCGLWKPYDMGNLEKKQILKGDRLTELDKSYKQAKRELEWFKEGKRQGREQMLKDAVEEENGKKEAGNG